jgi:hypothetical protein
VPANPSPSDYALFVDHETNQPILNAATRSHLWHCSAMLYDELRAMADSAIRARVLPWEDDEVTVMGYQDYLPPSMLQHCTWQTVRDFTHALDAVICKLGSRCWEGMLSNTMEEFVMRAIIERSLFQLDVTREMAEDDEHYYVGYDPALVDVAQLEYVRELAFPDADHEMLFMPHLDGIENDTETLTDMGVPDLHVESWLTPFGGAHDSGHPLSWKIPER